MSEHQTLESGGTRFDPSTLQSFFLPLAGSFVADIEGMFHLINIVTVHSRNIMLTLKFA